MAFEGSCYPLMLTPDSAEPLLDFDRGVSPFSGDSDHFWREHPSNNGTGLFILGQHYAGKWITGLSAFLRSEPCDGPWVRQETCMDAQTTPDKGNSHHYFEAISSV